MSDTNQRPPPPGKAEAIFAAWAARVEAGEKIEFEFVVRRHSEYARELEQLHDDWLQFAPLLSRVVPGLVASESGVLVPPLASAKDDDAPPSSDELFARLGLHGAGESRYRFRAVIGRGGGGVVLRVWDSKLNRALAMKVVLGREEERLAGDTPRVDGRTLSRFVDEARIAAQLNHPGIVPVHELGADEAGRAFFTMKLVKGEDLARIYERIFSGEGDWNPTRALTYLLRVCEAMAYAHDKGVVHRDLKPANVMVGPYGEVHVMDWGLARVLGEKDARDLRIRLQSPAPISAVDSFRAGERKASPESPLVTMDGSVIGTPAYMSPEQARGELEDVGPRSDVYAVGAMLYHLLTGEPPFSPRGATMPPHVVLLNVMHGPPKPVEELSPRAAPELVAICEKAMQRQSTSRYGSMLELAADLRAFLEGRVVEAYETGTWAETKKWVQRNKGLAASLLVTGLAVVGAIVSLARTASQQARAAEFERGARLEAQRLAARERAAADLAQQNERRAQRAEVDALAAEARADENARFAEESAYFATVLGAQAALNANETTNVRRLLDSAPERLRNWEWRYLDAILDESVLTLVGTVANWSPDGTRIVTGTRDGAAFVWDAQSGKQLARMDGHTAPVNSASFSPDGARVVTASSDHTARVWDTVSGLEVARLENHTTAVYSANFSADGTRVVTASGDHTARVWDSESGAERNTLDGHLGLVLAATFSPDGTRILTASADGVALVWDAITGRQTAKLEEESRSIFSAEFSRDGACIVTSSHDGLIQVWDATLGQEKFKLEGSPALTPSAKLGPDGKRVLALSGNWVPALWDIRSGEVLAKLVGHTSWVHSMSFNAEGTRIVTSSSDNTARVWDAQTGEELATLAGPIGTLSFASFSPDSARILTAPNEYDARVWDALPAPASTDVGDVDAGGTRSSFCRPDGARVVVTASALTARVRDAQSGEELAAFTGHTGGITAAEFSADGSRVVTASYDSTARVWDVSSGREIARLDGHGGPVWSAVFNPEGTRVVTASDDLTARVWDSRSGRELSRLEGHTSNVVAASFSPDGTRIVTAGVDEYVRVWDAQTGREVATLTEHGALLTSAWFTSDGTRIIAELGGEFGRVYDSVPNRVRHAERHTTEAGRPDGKRVLEDAIAQSENFVTVGARLREDASLDSIVRLAALRLLSERCNEARDNSRELERARAERTWIAHMLGHQPWRSETEAEAALNDETNLPTGADALGKITWRLVDPDEAPGDAMRALVLARRAVAAAEAEGVQVCGSRMTLARALFRRGRFDEALAEHRTALSHVVGYRKEACQKSLTRLEADIAEWRDENGQLRVATWTAKLVELDRQIAELEADPDVRMWLAYKR
jgi:WD40 repeat protein/serine/threonine protein kinase